MAEHRTRVRKDNRSTVPGYFATTLPGLGKLLTVEIRTHPALELVGEPGFDGRADIVFFRLRRGARFDPQELRLAEDVFVMIAEASSGAPGQVATSLVTRIDLERALSTWSRL